VNSIILRAIDKAISLFPAELFPDLEWRDPDTYYVVGLRDLSEKVEGAISPHFSPVVWSHVVDEIFIYIHGSSKYMAVIRPENFRMDDIEKSVRNKLERLLSNDRMGWDDEALEAVRIAILPD